MPLIVPPRRKRFRSERRKEDRGREDATLNSNAREKQRVIQGSYARGFLLHNNGNNNNARESAIQISIPDVGIPPFVCLVVSARHVNTRGTRYALFPIKNTEEFLSSLCGDEGNNAAPSRRMKMLAK